MEIKLLSNSPLEVADIAICKCYSNTPHTEDSKRVKRIGTVANQQKHASVIEHLVYSFDIDGISRACLQELARHRIASYTVKSSRYTLQELKSENNIKSEDTCGHIYTDYDIVAKYCVLPADDDVIESIAESLSKLQTNIQNGVPNDIAKYCMPEAYKTSLVMTINGRALQNFLNLRTSKKALWEIQNLANAMFEVLPENHKDLFIDYINR